VTFPVTAKRLGPKPVIREPIATFRMTTTAGAMTHKITVVPARDRSREIGGNPGSDHRPPTGENSLVVVP
jgi:hypothetical protein